MPPQAMAADLRAAEMRAADLSGELAAREDELARWRAEVEQLRGLVAQMDRDRDGLQVGSGAPRRWREGRAHEHALMIEGGLASTVLV